MPMNRLRSPSMRIEALNLFTLAHGAESGRLRDGQTAAAFGAAVSARAAVCGGCDAVWSRPGFDTMLLIRW